MVYFFHNRASLTEKMLLYNRLIVSMIEVALVTAGFVS